MRPLESYPSYREVQAKKAQAEAIKAAYADRAAWRPSVSAKVEDGMKNVSLTNPLVVAPPSRFKVGDRIISSHPIGGTSLGTGEVGTVTMAETGWFGERIFARFDSQPNIEFACTNWIQRA